MKNVLTFCFLLVACTFSYAQNKCEEFKTGEFINTENGIVKATIQRNDSIQTEQFSGKEIKLRITWIDDCSYRLKFLEGNEAFLKSRPKDTPMYDLMVKIISVNGDSYVQESRFIDYDGDTVYISTIKKVK
ncbi:hypothetical protein [uncultured Kordia sp.]|uniref:hypothetical protein n=1 Tax=uncultured Kordia sp. TaxID=507699 RepID=UPI002636C717|nr:hypothetical protein [uncultured Kordia sp.]